MTARNGDWIQTFTHRKFWPLDPHPDEIFIEDIAHALAMQCRFTGHVQEFYSVAQHSVAVSWHCDPADALWGLLHDAAEAYLVDVARPVKKDDAFSLYRAAEDRIQAAVRAKCRMNGPIHVDPLPESLCEWASSVVFLMADGEPPPPFPWIEFKKRCPASARATDDFLDIGGRLSFSHLTSFVGLVVRGVARCANTKRRPYYIRSTKRETGRGSQNCAAAVAKVTE